MFYYASKIISFFIWPSNVIAMLLVVGAALVLTGRWLRWGRRMLAGGLLLMLTCGYGPVGNWLLLPLENRFSRGVAPADAAGVIILGGFENGGLAKDRGELALTDAAERLTEGILVALSRPLAKVVFSGDDGSLLGTSSGVATTVGQYLEKIGIPRDRIVLEGQSRTTWENALLLREMLKPQPGQRWVLVTSAFHMPRSVGVFRKIGFDVVPWPSDYRTRGLRDAAGYHVAFPSGLEKVDIAFKEWVGLLAYTLTGRSTSLWPGPQEAGNAVRPAAKK